LADDRPPLTLVDAPGPPASDLEVSVPPTREEMLEAIPLTVVVADDVDLGTADPALIADGLDAGRRVCIATRRAGGRCTANAPADALLCNAHSGRLDPRSGGLARAAAQREARNEAEREAAAGRLGTRGLIAAVFREEAAQLGQALRTLIALAADGDRAAALALIPYLNQGLGMPTERVEVGAPSSAADLAAMGTDELAAFVAARRAKQHTETATG
jgi:hypothetical protein